jgi:hypothetical protein
MLRLKLQKLVILCALSVATATGLQKYNHVEQSSNTLSLKGMAFDDL